MPVIRKQATSNSIIAFAGIALGYFNITIVFPKLLTQEVFGLTQVLIAAMVMLSNTGSLGLRQSVVRFFPIFNSSKKLKDSFTGFMLSVCFLGILLTCASIFLFEAEITAKFAAKSPLFNRFYYLLYPLAVFGTLNVFLDAYAQSLFKSGTAAFHREIALRVLQLLAVVAFYFDLFGLEAFLWFFISIQGGFTLLMVGTLSDQNFFTSRFKWVNLPKELIKDFSLYSVVFILGGNTLFSSIDVLFVGSMVGLEATAVYGVAVAIGTILMVPSRSLLRVANAVASEAWAENNIKRIERIYEKSALNNMILGGALFLLLMANLDLLKFILPKSFQGGFNVIIIVGITKLVHLSTGINSGIISTSSDYYMNAIFNVGSAIVMVMSNLYFIPRYGIEGAAIAMLITALAQNISKTLFLGFKYNLQPFNLTYFKVIALGCVSLALFWSVDGLRLNEILTCILKSVLVCIAFIFPIIRFSLSVDLNQLIQDALARGNWLKDKLGR